MVFVIVLGFCKFDINRNKIDLVFIRPDPEIMLVTSKRLKTKTLLFVENIRPPYCGTWRKKSTMITPLNPLAEDKSFFDYELDSDQEWEYESGEDIGSSEVS